MGTVTRLQALKEALAKGDRKEIEAAAGRVERIGGIPGALGKEIAGNAKALPGKVFEWDNFSRIIYTGLAYLLLAIIGIKLLGRSVGKFIAGFPIVFGLCLVIAVPCRECPAR